MCELTGKISNISNDYFSNKVQITFEIEQTQSARKCYDDFKDIDKLSIKVSRYREKRTDEANRYLWVLCTKLADERSKDGVFVTKEDVYRDEIRCMNIYRDYLNLPLPEAQTLQTAWRMLGTGWVAEQVDYSADGESVTIRCYYGSSQYNKAQMKRLLEKVIQDCHALNIETRTPDEIADMISLWNSVEERNEKHTAKQ